MLTQGIICLLLALLIWFFFLLACDIYSHVYYGNVSLKMNFFSLAFEHFGNVFTLKDISHCLQPF